MIAPTHLKIGSRALEDTSIERDFEVYKFVFLFGCIAPDINFIYPFHNIHCTPRRFQKRIIRMSKIKSKLIRSFTLGVIMHYICDYFCLAHNNQSYGAKHTLYERLMSHKLTTDRSILNKDTETIEDCWKVAVQEYEDGGTNLIDDIVESSYINCAKIYVLVKNMNELYLECVASHSTSSWYTDSRQMDTDISWALFMCDKVAALV